MPATKTATRLLRSRLLNALTFPYGTERYVEMIDPLASRTDIRAEVTAVHHQSPRSVTITLSPNQNWPGAKAGQFSGLGIEINGRRESRQYSLASSEHEIGGQLEFTISTHPDGLVSRWLRDNAKPGLLVHVEPPAGEFVLPSPRPGRILLICGGSGITPVMAMARTLRDEGFTGEIGFLRYARTPELALYETEIAELQSSMPGFNAARAYTQAKGGEISGRFTREHAERVMPKLDGAATFVCGPPALIDAVRTEWAEAGLPEPVSETFTPPAFEFDPAAATGTIRFAGSETEFENSGLPLLDQAEEAGLDPDHGCRMGICNTCSCRKTSGTVRNLLTGDTSSAEDEHIRLCISVPLGDVEIDA